MQPSETASGQTVMAVTTLRDVVEKLVAAQQGHSSSLDELLAEATSHLDQAWTILQKKIDDMTAPASRVT